MDIIYIKLNLSAQIIEHNKNLTRFFQLADTNTTNLSLASLLSIEEDKINGYINKIRVGEQRSFIFFCNNSFKPGLDNNAMLILYSLINRHSDYFTVKIVNWLNWIHRITDSMENNYTIMSKFNRDVDMSVFNKISDAPSYKALYPLISYIPNKFSNSISVVSMFEIMRVFIKQRNGNARYSRSYLRNVHSRIRTNLKKEYNLISVEAIDLIKNDDLLNIVFNGEICIPNTSLAKNIILAIHPDALLISIINVMPIGELGN